MHDSNSKSYKDIIQISSKLKEKLPTSYDTIGNIALIKLDDNLIKFKEQIGEALIEANKNIKTVYLAKPVKGEYRTRNFEIIAGEKKTETIHKEFGLTFYIDIEKAYFSPRLANERRRISKLVKSGEVIVDMFTGVAPFPIMIAKNANPEIVFGIDKNKDAIDLAKKNITINRVLDKVEIINDDAKNATTILEKYKAKADRIIMNLPFSSFNFFETALEIIGNNATIHYYDIQHEDKIKDRIDELIKTSNKKDVEITNYKINKIKSYSPHEFYIGIDITAKRK